MRPTKALAGRAAVLAAVVIPTMTAAGLFGPPPVAGRTAGPACAKVYEPGMLLDPAMHTAGSAMGTPRLRADLFSGPKTWGMADNLRLRRVAGAPAALVLEARLPKGSINPSNHRAPLGGVGFRWAPGLPRGVRAACLTYGLWLPKDFAFNRGGKLPGLYGGSGPNGGRRANGVNGFSLRLMWRRGGAGEVYAYIPGHPPGRGRSIGRGSWKFPRGRWFTVSEEVVLDRPGGRDGALRVWIDGVLRLERRGVGFRTSPAVTIAGVMAHVFYGGKSPGWAAPADTVVRFTPFDLRWR